MQIKLSAKKLGEVAMPTFCPRCFWLKYRLGNKLPFSTFPSIFGTIDRHTKGVVHGYFDEHGEAPQWLAAIVPDAVGYIDPPRSFDFKMNLAPDFLLSGEPDGILTLKDGSLCVVDYKTAFHKGDKDPLLPIYQVQLNCYALLAAAHSLGESSRLTLLYSEPLVGNAFATDAKAETPIDFALGFHVKHHDIPLDVALVERCVKLARSTVRSERPPAGRIGCEDCTRITDLVLAIQSTAASAYASIFPALT